MTYDDLNILIPCYSLEDFPTDLEEEQAASLLNAFAVVWHPELIASSGVIPSNHPASDPPDKVMNRLFVIPISSETWLEPSWIERAQDDGAVLIRHMHDRAEMANAILESLPERVDVDPELVADFYALGVCHLQVELLTRLMHHFCNIDEVHLQRETVSAAEAAMAGNETDARKHLRNCFEVLTEARERFYPVDCYLVDLCLLNPDQADEHLSRALQSNVPMNFLLTSADLEIIASEKPEIIVEFKNAWNEETIDFCGGDWKEGPLPVMPLASAIHTLSRGIGAFQTHLGRRPNIWGRRRFGLNTQLPQLLKQFQFTSCLHVLLDDGLYPDTEHSKVRWEGCDGTTIDAMSRIPLAVDNAASFLRFATQMSESMEEDTVGAVVFARWPELKSPWLGDLQRMNRYSHALGRFTTFQNFFDRADDPGRVFSHEAHEYLSPFLLHAVAAREENVISRFARHFVERQRFDRLGFIDGLNTILKGGVYPESPFDAEERQFEEPFLTSTFDSQKTESPSSDSEEANPVSTQPNMSEVIQKLETQTSQELANLIVVGNDDTTGALILNPHSFERTVAVNIPHFQNPPRIDGQTVLGTQFDQSRQQAVVKLPPAGFAWLEQGEETPEKRKQHVPLVEENTIRNEFFEVHINPETGGITKVKEYGRKPNRLSQQIAFRFPRERTIVQGQGYEATTTSTYYSAMKCDSIEVTSDGPLMGEMVVKGQIIDQEDDSTLASYTQTIRMWRHRPFAEIDLTIDPIRLPEGDPWSNYYAARFAWNDASASLTGAVLEGAHATKDDRIESPYYLEVANDSERTTILSHGRPFYRKTGMRMADGILIVEGEKENQFRFTIAFDHSYPMQAAVDTLLPPVVVPTTKGRASSSSGWFFHVDAPNVQIRQILPACNNKPIQTTAANDNSDPNEADVGEPHHQIDDDWQSTNGFALRLVETEGHRRHVKLNCFRTPTKARQRDFCGKTILDLRIEGDAVLIDVSAYDIIDLELSFDDSHN